MQRSHLLAPLFLATVAMPLASAQAEAFVEASTHVQKIGFEMDDLRPFLAGTVGYVSASDLTYTTYSVGAGFDWTRPVQEVDLGLRGIALLSSDTESSVKVYEFTAAALAKKKFGILSVGGAIGPSLRTFESGSDDFTTIGLGSELFVSLNF